MVLDLPVLNEQNDTKLLPGKRYTDMTKHFIHTIHTSMN